MKWDQQTKTLTLTNADLSYSTTVVDIRESGVTIKLEGNNKITCTGTNHGDCGIYYGGYGLKINGSGKLTVNTENICITDQHTSPFQGDIVIDGATLDLNSAKSDCLNGKTVTIQNGAKITATAGGKAIFADDGDLLIDDSTVEATSGGSDYALYGETAVKIQNNANVTACQANAELEDYAAIGAGYNITIDSSKVKAQAASRSYGIKGQITIKGNSDVEAEGGWAFSHDGTLEPTEKYLYRIYAGDSKSTAEENWNSPLEYGESIPYGEDFWGKKYLHIYSECVHDWQFDGFEWQQPGQIVHRDSICATYSCKNDPTHTFKEHNQLVITESRLEPTCEKDGGAKFTAEIDASVSKDGQYHKGEKEVIEPGTATGHTFNQKKAEEGYLKTAADCTHPAEYYVSCSKCDASSKGEGDKEASFESGDPLGHDWYQDKDHVAFEYYNETAGDGGKMKCMATLTCKRESSHTQEVYSNASIGYHDTLPTCEDPGSDVIDYSFPEPYQWLTPLAKATTSVPPTGHLWGEWEVTKKPTALGEGEEKRICKHDSSHIETKAIAATGVSGTALSKMKAKGKTSLIVSWSKIKGAEGYDIFFTNCSKTSKYKKVKTIKGNKTFSWTKTGLKKEKPYKAHVKA